ncbi:DNA-binding response regulator [Salipaludibacillus neizhouensis]|uniref:DNA-binding response regulator n=1 Tax=Salipaludibacillus neizhouensis TaxID=885475 RepID=A0A3A9K209_9BACI|nr:response regulator [Salipaludibacillus neizhouensis]RKL67174.1 DNA-binding response regulator [Salipaludibacillus neizhouensis]
MYDVLVVDDEINILEGIAAIVDWESIGARLAGKSSNGKMAFERIKENPPDIVVTDIKMPGMNGIELIEAVYDIFPDIRFIVLSGFNEFEFAKTAMRCGVKHYLLKPSNEKKIEEALKQIVDELDMGEEKEQFIKGIQKNLQKVIPKAKEQFLREFIINKKYDLKELSYYRELFGMEEKTESYRLLAFIIDDKNDYENLLILKEMVTSELGKARRILLSTIISERIVLLIDDSPTHSLIEKIKRVQEKWQSYYDSNFTTSISSISSITNLHSLYQEILEGMSQRFYLGSGGIVTANDIYVEESSHHARSFNHEELILAIRSGNEKEAVSYLNQFFHDLTNTKAEVQIVRSHCFELLMSLIRQTKTDVMDDMFKKVKDFHTYSTLQEIEKFIKKMALEIVEINYEAKKTTQNKIVNQVLVYTNAHVGEEALSLSYIASDVFFMNPDYLGKLFKKETGDKFSTYLMRLRMSEATKLIQQTDEVRVFEVAEAVGFGNNPRYFSQVFKKHTGYTPSEYKKISS